MACVICGFMLSYTPEEKKMSKPSFMVGILSLALFLAVAMSANRWEQATATFYGGPDGGETFDGACGYRKVCGYGVQNTALSTALFNNGLTCGACFEIQCYKSKWCHPGKIRVTATNFCPGGGVGWCNPPNKHFDLSQPMFLKIGEYKAGVIPVIYQRVPCLKSGGIKFELKGNPWFLRVLVYNVGGVGDVHQVSIKGSKTGWIQMSRSWGQVWDTGYQLLGQSLSFQVTTSDGKMVQSDNVAPAFWQFSQTYEGKQF